MSIVQDNEPLMRALSKLIYVNSPDLILFVGEALVGNDAVDQLSKFNQVCWIFGSSFNHLSIHSPLHVIGSFSSIYYRN